MYLRLLPVCPLLCALLVACITSGCAKKTLVVMLPEGSGYTQEQLTQINQTVNTSLSILKQLDDHTDSIEIIMPRKTALSASTNEDEPAF